MCFQEVLLGIIGIFLPPSMKRKTRISSHLRSLACIAAALNSISRRFFSQTLLMERKDDDDAPSPSDPEGIKFSKETTNGLRDKEDCEGE